MASILLVDDQASVLTSLSILLKRQGHHVRSCQTVDESKKALATGSFDLVITDLRMRHHFDGMEVLRVSLSYQPNTPVIIMTGYGTIENAVEAVKLGAFDYLTKGFSNEQFLKKIDEALGQRHLSGQDFQGSKRPPGFEHIVGQSEALVRVLHLVARVAPFDNPILLNGESGTGKELIAQAIHAQSARRQQPFLAINCGAFPDSLLESELFGHVKGSFTGATRDTEGLFVAADHGTLFLDEVGEMSQAMQIKLLRVLQEWVVRPVGSTQGTLVNVRVISATNKDLKSEIQKGLFREDLYFRLCVMPVSLPPLRERTEDIPLLADFFLKTFAQKYQRDCLLLDRTAKDFLVSQTWPGNVRELENFLERVMLLTDKKTLTRDDLNDLVAPAAQVPMTEKHASLAEQEREHILRVLEDVAWNQSEAARQLGIGRTTLWRKMKAYNIPSR
jgi:two-component system response regulator HydG